jgi:hypothetical protein
MPQEALFRVTLPEVRGSPDPGRIYLRELKLGGVD